MATALTANPGQTQGAPLAQSWLDTLEKKVNPSGQLRDGPRYIPTGGTIAELIADIACHRGLSVDDLVGWEPAKARGGKQYCKCKLCLSSMLDNDRSKNRHLVSDVHLNYISEYCHVDRHALMSLARTCERCNEFRSYRRDAMKAHLEKCGTNPQTRGKGKRKAISDGTLPLLLTTNASLSPPLAFASHSSATPAPVASSSTLAGPLRQHRSISTARDTINRPYTKSAHKTSEHNQNTIASVDQWLRMHPRDTKSSRNELPPASRPLLECEKQILAGLTGDVATEIQRQPLPIKSEDLVVQLSGHHNLDEAAFDLGQDLFDQFVVNNPDLFEPSLAPPSLPTPCKSPYVSELQHALGPPVNLEKQQHQQCVVPPEDPAQDVQPVSDPNVHAENILPDVDFTAFFHPPFASLPPLHFPQFNPPTMSRPQNFAPRFPFNNFPFGLPSFPAFSTMPRGFGPMARNTNRPLIYGSAPVGLPQQMPNSVFNMSLADMWSFGDVSYQNSQNFQGFFPSYPAFPC